LLWYCRGFADAADLQRQMKRVSSADDVEGVLENYIRSRTDTAQSVQLVPTVQIVQ
jgi:hypothetical protein